MNPGPAPTLVFDWATPQAFWAFLGLAAFAATIYYATEALKRAWRAKSVELDRVLKQSPPPRRVCFIEVCDRPGLYPTHTRHGIQYVCRRHSGQVGDWTGAVYDQVYDQQLDPASDLAQWEKEMPA